VHRCRFANNAVLRMASRHIHFRKDTLLNVRAWENLLSFSNISILHDMDVIVAPGAIVALIPAILPRHLHA